MTEGGNDAKGELDDVSPRPSVVRSGERHSSTGLLDEYGLLENPPAVVDFIGVNATMGGGCAGLLSLSSCKAGRTLRTGLFSGMARPPLVGSLFIGSITLGYCCVGVLKNPLRPYTGASPVGASPPSAALSVAPIESELRPGFARVTYTDTVTP